MSAAGISPEAVQAISTAVSVAFGIAEELVRDVVEHAAQNLDTTPLPDAEGEMLAARHKAEERT